MRRRALVRGLALGAALGLPGSPAALGLPGSWGAPNLPESTPVALARPASDSDRAQDRRPISIDNPRIWPAVSRRQPLPMGAVDAFRAPDRAAEMGVQWQRIMFDWSALQPFSQDEWGFVPGWQVIAKRERDQGRPVVGQLMSTPGWASGTTDPKAPPLGLDLPLDDPRNLWAAWVTGLVTRFAGLIDTWVIWNEPDVWSDENHARQWTGSLEQYYQLLRTGYRAAHLANPNVTILLAGLTYWWDAAYNREQYFDRLLRCMIADPTAPANNWYFDAAVLQLYNNPRGLFDAPRIFHDLMRVYGLDKPVWVNETNAIPWDDPAAPLTRAHFRATMDEQANYLVQATAYALAGGVDRMAVYKMVDDSPLQKHVDQAFGILRADDSFSVRPIFRAFQMLRREMTATVRAQVMDEGVMNRVYLEQPTLGRRMTVLWNCSAQPREAQIPALGPRAQLMDRWGNVQPVDVANDGHIHITLAAATANTVPGYPETYFIGGEPALLLEALPGDYIPYPPTYANLPDPGQS